jgi:hypothetical protein
MNMSDLPGCPDTHDCRACCFAIIEDLAHTGSTCIEACGCCDGATPPDAAGCACCSGTVDVLTGEIQKHLDMLSGCHAEKTATAGLPLVSRIMIKLALRKALPQADAVNAPKILAVDDAHEALAGALHYHMFQAPTAETQALLAQAPSGNLLAQIIAFLTSPQGQQLILLILSLFGIKP